MKTNKIKIITTKDILANNLPLTVKCSTQQQHEQQQYQQPKQPTKSVKPNKEKQTKIKAKNNLHTEIDTDGVQRAKWFIWKCPLPGYGACLYSTYSTPQIPQAIQRYLCINVKLPDWR